MVKALFFFMSIFAVIVLDQWTKILVLDRFEYGESIPVILDFFNLTYVRNTGAAFGLMADANPAFRVPFFIAIPIVATVILGFLYRDLPAKSRWGASALGMITGGALGNLIDRIRLGYVVDFLDFHWKHTVHYPAFNVADAAICVGVGILLITQLYQKEENRGVPNSVRH